MIVMLAVLMIPLAYLVGLGHWAKALLSGRWRRPPWLAATAGLLLPPAVLTWLWGVGSGGLDEAEACGLSGHQYDRDYAFAHRSDAFPLRHPCNAQHDLVAGWLNPTLALLVVTACAFAAAAAVVAVRRAGRVSR